MIITFTPNPSLDRTALLPGGLRQGHINRLGDIATLAAGKGVNISAAVNAAGHPTRAILPLDSDDPLAEALRKRGVPATAVPVGHRARQNLTVSHPDGTTTKLNEPGETLSRENVTALASAVMSALPGASWLALCGSLPPGAPVDWYARLTQRAHEVGVKVAVDVSGPALISVVDALPRHAPDILAPNAGELEKATGVDLCPSLMEGDIRPSVEAARQLVDAGCPTVLATLGVHGALLATRDAVWHAQPAPIAVVSAVSAGDAALAGYLLASTQGMDEPERLRRAVAYGTATVQMPGSEVPRPELADQVHVSVERIDDAL